MMMIRNFTSTLCLLTLLPTLALGATNSATNSEGEIIPLGEEKAILQVTKKIREQVQAEAEKNGHAFRDAHRKHHGCVQSTFTVENNLPEALRQGLFREASSYKAIVRYSNGSGQAKDDHEGDGRGMAVKVLGVKGERNLHEKDDELNTQDFLMINHPVFFVRDAEDYLSFQEAVTNNTVVWWMLNPLRVFHEGRIAKTIRDKTMMNPLNSNYWSMTASKLGSQQMKFRAIPCAGSKFKSPSDSSDRLKENLAATLEKGDACFDFQVQLRLDPSEQPIEDPTMEWEEETAPFTTVAKIRIPQQSPETGEACETLSFNPWNGLAEMRPLGGISRVRREVYQAISRFRHEFNRQLREEPRE